MRYVHINELTGLFIKHADKVMINFTKIYDSVLETMRILKSKGIKHR